MLQQVGVGLEGMGLDAAASKGGLGVLQLSICLGCNFMYQIDLY